MIKISGLIKRFEDTEALTSLTMKVNKGSIYGLLGSNGAGKTTLLKTLAGIYQEDEGEVQINEEPVFENESLKQRLIMVPDTLYFFPGFTVEEMADFYRKIYHRWTEERYRQLESVFGISRQQKIQKLSKGMQRQVAFWLSLSVMPDIMILDEPLDGLDSVMRQKVKNLLVQDVAEREMTIIISSHNLREMEDFCDHVGILHQGKLLLEKDLDELKKDIHKIQIAFKETPPEEMFQKMNILHTEKRGSVHLMIIRGVKEKLIEEFKAFQPVIVDILPLTLEEIFIYEMGDHAYEVDQVIFA